MTEPRMINLETAMQKAAVDEFWAARGTAVQAYANLEQSLCQLFSALAGVSREIGGIIFFRIASTDARNKIIDKLFKLKFGEGFNLFRSSLIRQLDPIGRRRNEIVHWNTIHLVGLDEAGETASTLVMQPGADVGAFDVSTPRIGTKDLQDFVVKCGFYSRLSNMFFVVELAAGKDQVPDADRQRWHDIFAQTIEFPPLGTHPLASGALPLLSPGAYR
jgi:hypothetical protein